MNASIGTAAIGPISTATPALMEGSITLAIIVYLIKEGLSIFKNKDAHEDRLITRFVDDLRIERSQHNQQTLAALQKLEISNGKIAAAIDKIAIAITQIDRTNQSNARTNTENLAQLQRQEKLLKVLADKVEALQNQTR